MQGSAVGGAVACTRSQFMVSIFHPGQPSRPSLRDHRIDTRLVWEGYTTDVDGMTIVSN